MFGLPVSRGRLDSDSFALVVAFGRYKFWLSVDSVGLIIQAVIGGSADQFFVSQISPSF